MTTATLARSAPDRAPSSSLKICSRCIYDERVSKIQFDSDGVCNYCKLIASLEAEYETGTPAGEARYAAIVEDIKRAGRGKPYDCVVGVSGGTDSSYMLARALADGLRPLAVHYDNTWNTAVATENIKKVTKALKVDLFTYVVDNKEVDDVFLAFFKASVPELDGPTDIALAEVLYRAASKYGVKYILEGHSFRAEGVSPLGTMYIDGRYIAEVHRRFGTMPIKTFPNMGLRRFLYWTAVKQIKKIRPLWYLPSSKSDARDYLAREFGWEYYGGHHLENRMTAFHHTFYNPQKFDLDQRNNSLSAAVRSGVMTRTEALAIYSEPTVCDPQLLEYLKKRLGLSAAAFDELMARPRKSFRDYPTYKRTFERLRPLFWVMYRSHLVPKSFYVKFTSKDEV